MRETSGALTAMLRPILVDPSARESVLAEVYAQVWRCAGRYDQQAGSGMTWLRVIARCRAIDHLRKVRRRREGLQDPEVFDRVGSARMEPSEIVTTHENGRVVREAILALSGDQRRAVSAAFYEGMSHSEIASAFGEPLGTIKTRIRSAMIALKTALQVKGLDVQP